MKGQRILVLASSLLCGSLGLSPVTKGASDGLSTAQAALESKSASFGSFPKRTFPQGPACLGAAHGSVGPRPSGPSLLLKKEAKSALQQKLAE